MIDCSIVYEETKNKETDEINDDIRSWIIDQLTIYEIFINNVLTSFLHGRGKHFSFLSVLQT